MPVQVAAYPQAIPVFTTKIDLQDIVFAAHINQLQLEAAAISTELGTLPKGTATSVRARIEAIEAAISTITGSISDTGLSTVISTETTNRTTADTNLQNQINALSATVAALTAGIKVVSAGIVGLASTPLPHSVTVALVAHRKYYIVYFPNGVSWSSSAGFVSEVTYNVTIAPSTNPSDTQTVASGTLFSGPAEFLSEDFKTGPAAGDYTPSTNGSYIIKPAPTQTPNVAGTPYLLVLDLGT